MEKNKKMYILFVVVVVVLMILAALAGAGIAIHFNNNDDGTSASDEANIPSEPSTDAVISPSGVVADPSATDANASNVVDPNAPSENATENISGGVTVGPYTTGDFYFYNADGKNLKLRASASADVDTGVEIPSGTKLAITQIIASNDAAYPYWGATSYRGTDGYVALQFLMTAADYEAEYGDQISAPGNYKAGTYVVYDTGDYGLKVKAEPGYGDALTMIYDGDEIEVLDIQTWDEADDDELLYWGHIEWEGHDAYVCMAYLQKVD